MFLCPPSLLGTTCCKPSSTISSLVIITARYFPTSNQSTFSIFISLLIIIHLTDFIISSQLILGYKAFTSIDNIWHFNFVLLLSLLKVLKAARMSSELLHSVLFSVQSVKWFTILLRKCPSLLLGALLAPHTGLTGGSGTGL